MKNLMIGAVAAAAALATPVAAGATVVPGATYSGEFTTGTGGTAELVVSADGTEVEFSAVGFGQTGCDGISFVTFPLAITDDSFALSIQGPPVVAAFGTFGDPGTVSGSARNTTFCESGLQSWTAETPVVWPDGRIARAGAANRGGDDLYNTSGANQVRKWTARPGQGRKFAFDVQNDGTEIGSFDVKGCRSSKGFKVKYANRGDNVTAAVGSGNFASDALDTDETEPIALTIKATKKAKPGKTKSCRITATHDDLNDVVKAELKVTRG